MVPEEPVVYWRLGHGPRPKKTLAMSLGPQAT